MDEINLKLQTIKFSFGILQEELKWLRGALISATDGSDSLLHNHKIIDVIYRYPTIQYKKVQNNAGLLLIGDAIESLGKISMSFNKKVRIGNRYCLLEPEYIRTKEVVIKTGTKYFYYSLSNWMPLNQENYNVFKQIANPDSKVEMLDKILTGNILAFLEGIQYIAKDRIEARIMEVENDKVLPYKGQKMQAFDLVFQTNVFLPNYIGLGKGVSLGFGTIKEIRKYYNIPL